MGKRNKLKKALSPVLPANMASTNDDDDQDLMNDLLAQLDSRDEIVQQESANVLNEMNLNQQANKLESKQDAKSRFKARQVGLHVSPAKDTTHGLCRPEKRHPWRRATLQTIPRQRRGCRKKQKMKKETLSASAASSAWKFTR
jgi:hypothetical protein